MLRWTAMGAVILALSPLTAKSANVETLPSEVRSPQMRLGMISGLDGRYASDSQLYHVGDLKSVPFDAKTLARVNERAQALIRALDVFGSGNYGSQINLGTLKVETRPQLTYSAPVFAYGLSNTWTLALGAPLMRYQNQISLHATPGNLDFYRRNFSGINAELDEALAIDLPTEARKVIAQKGYKPIEDRDQSFMGDLQAVLLHRLPDRGEWKFMHQMTFTLPTGPQDDPDDLMGLNMFHRTAWENTLTAAKSLSPRWTFLPSVSLLMPIPDRLVKRVPRDEGDFLPDASARTNLTRTLGPTATLGADLEWSFRRDWVLRGGGEVSTKAQDHYAGAGRTDLLEKDTAATATRVRGGVAFTSVQSYFDRHADLPSQVSLDVSDTIAGRNVERQLRTELSATLFF